MGSIPELGGAEERVAPPLKKTGNLLLELHNKIVSRKIFSTAQWKRIRQQIQYDGDRSLPTPVSFSMLDY